MAVEAHSHMSKRTRGCRTRHRRHWAGSEIRGRDALLWLHEGHLYISKPFHRQARTSVASKSLLTLFNVSFAALRFFPIRTPPPQPHINIPHGVNNTFGMEHSLSSAFESRLSVQSSTSSSLSGWAPRARSASLSSQSSNDSVNLDALIAEGSDINEECPLQLEEADDVEWSRVQQQQQQQQQALFEEIGRASCRERVL